MNALSVSVVTALTVRACVAGVRKGRGRELGRDTTRERGGRREEGNACKEAIVFAIPSTN